MEANDFLMGGGVQSAKFDKIGASVKGVIARKPEVQTQRDFDSGKPLTWDDGSERKQIKVVLVTDERNDDDDNGERALYLKGKMLAAVREAVKKVGAKGIEAGGKLAVKYVKDGERKGKLNAPKLYTAMYEAPTGGVAVDEVKATSEDDEDLKF